MVLDFGGQYTHLIASRVRNMGAACEIMPGDADPEKMENVKGIILSGGPSSVLSSRAVLPNKGIFEMNVPVLGICYGHQVVAHMLGGTVRKGNVSEYGPTKVSFFKKKGIFSKVRNIEPVWMSHFDQVVTIPPDFEIIGKTDDCPIAAMANPARNIFTVQFHPEVTHTVCGSRILENFVDLTGVKREWDVQNMVDGLVEDIKKKAGDKNVFLLVSGGVDSTVAFLLLSKALGQDRVYGLFVDTGFMRKGEGEQVRQSMVELGFENLHVKDASEEFFKALDGVFKPEEKRKIIGDLFLKIKDDVALELKLNDDEWLIGQGTIYPDTIETGGTANAKKIKTHHNRVPKIQKLIEAGKVIEPLVEFYKDEVRLVGEKLGLGHHLLNRHPFPGPGLAVRCLAAEKSRYPEGHKVIEKNINISLADYGLSANILPIKSVGVQGDERTYRNPLLLSNSNLSWDEYGTLATKLINNFHSINRVLLRVAPDSFESVNIKETPMTRERVGLLQEADSIVMDFIKEVNIYDEIWQFATVLLPVSLDSDGKESIVLRPVASTDAMTANFYQMDINHLHELQMRLMSLSGIGAVFYDLTNKPPGTIEWE